MPLPRSIHKGLCPAHHHIPASSSRREFLLDQRRHRPPELLVGYPHSEVLYSLSTLLKTPPIPVLSLAPCSNLQHKQRTFPQQENTLTARCPAPNFQGDPQFKHRPYMPEDQRGIRNPRTKHPFHKTNPDLALRHKMTLNPDS